jgi:hypothetical protein
MLTKRNDVIVRAHADADMAIDLLVEVLKDGKSALRLFGVQVIGCMDLPDRRNMEQRVFSHLPGEVHEAAFPVCVLLIAVRKPEGLYRWLAEPVIADGRAQLHRDVESSWQVLDDAGAARLIGQVIDWYEARQGTPPPKMSNLRAKMDS